MFNLARGNAVDCLVPFLLEYNWAKLIPNVYRVSSCWPTTNVVEIVINDMHNYERQKHRHNLLRLPRQSNSKPIYEAVSQAKTSHSCCCCRCFSCCLSLANRFDYNNESNLLTLHLSRFNISLTFISAFLLFHCVAYF